MKKVLSCILISAVVILLVFSLCACSNEDSKIIGEWIWDRWQAENTNSMFDFSSIKFNSDKTISGIARKDGKSMETWTWSYDKKNKRYNIENEFRTDWHAQILSNGELLIESEFIDENGRPKRSGSYTFTKKS